MAIPWTPEGTRDERSGTDARGHRAVGFVHGIFDPRALNQRGKHAATCSDPDRLHRRELRQMCKHHPWITHIPVGAPEAPSRQEIWALGGWSLMPSPTQLCQCRPQYTSMPTLDTLFDPTCSIESLLRPQAGSRTMWFAVVRLLLLHGCCC